VFQQWAQAGLAPIEGVERINAVMVCPNQRIGLAQCNPYAINVDQGNRNCFNCGRFGYMARNCRNKRTGNRIGEGRRLEYGQILAIEGNNRQNNLKEKGDLIVFN